jgi:hypothetical protein
MQHHGPAAAVQTVSDVVALVVGEVGVHLEWF